LNSIQHFIAAESLHLTLKHALYEAFWKEPKGSDVSSKNISDSILQLPIFPEVQNGNVVTSFPFLQKKFRVSGIF